MLNLLNKGDMKAIQVLPQVGVKTAYCIITHRWELSPRRIFLFFFFTFHISYRSLNGKFKSFEELATAPFWRGKGWERFEKVSKIEGGTYSVRSYCVGTPHWDVTLKLSHMVQ